MRPVHAATGLLIAVAVAALSPTVALGATPGPIASPTSITLPDGDNDWTRIGLSHNAAQAYVTYLNQAGTSNLAIIDLSAKTLTKTFGIRDPRTTPQSNIDSTSIIMTTDRVQVLDPATGQATAQLPDLKLTGNIVIGPLGRQIYVVDSSSGKANALLPNTLDRVWTKPVCARSFVDVTPDDPEMPGPDINLAITPDGSTLLAACPKDGLQFISTKSGKVLKTIPGVTSATPALISADGKRAYLTSNTTVTSIDLTHRKVVKRADVYQSSDGARKWLTNPWSTALGNDGKTLFIVWDVVKIMKAVDTSTLKATRINVGAIAKWKPIGVATDPSGKHAYALSTQQLVTLDAKSLAVIGIDTAAPSGHAAEALVATDSSVTVTWEATNSGDAAQVGVTMLDMP